MVRTARTVIKMAKIDRRAHFEFTHVLQGGVQVQVGFGVIGQVVVVGHNDSHDVILERIALDKHLSHELAS